MKIQA